MSSIPSLPRPVGVVYAVQRPLYEAEMARQIEQAIKKQGEGDLEKLLTKGETWDIQ
jgi:2-oxoglutarate ferredoxin oxidoreductase subunit beta